MLKYKIRERNTDVKKTKPKEKAKEKRTVLK
jgi:hypothetical protein